MKDIKKLIIISGIFGIISIAWIFLPEVTHSKEECFKRLFGNLISYKLFTKIQHYYFLLLTFIFIASIRHWTYKGFSILAMLALIPILIKLYVYYCTV